MFSKSMFLIFFQCGYKMTYSLGSKRGLKVSTIYIYLFNYVLLCYVKFTYKKEYDQKVVLQ